MKVGCICNELIARNLEPCCKDGQSASTTAGAREDNLPWILSNTVAGNICVKKERCDGDDVKAFPKKGEFCGSETTIRCSVLENAGCCGTEEKSNCCDTTRKSGCSDEISADCCSSEKKLGGSRSGEEASVFDEF